LRELLQGRLRSLGELSIDLTRAPLLRAAHHVKAQALLRLAASSQAALPRLRNPIMHRHSALLSAHHHAARLRNEIEAGERMRGWGEGSHGNNGSQQFCVILRISELLRRTQGFTASAVPSSCSTIHFAIYIGTALHHDRWARHIPTGDFYAKDVAHQSG
jgi:hypothetical protein